jgi:glycosyltransferase involved in cell wall biosynthesis
MLMLDPYKGYPLAVVLPRGTSFGPVGATSIDLCVHDFVLNSRYVGATRIHCSAVVDPFVGFEMRFDECGNGGQVWKALRFVRRIKEEGASLTVVHQHLPTAFFLSKFLPHPVLLHAHNFQKDVTPPLSRMLRRWRYSGLAGIIFVSEECRRDFLFNWPEIEVPTFVVHNGLDLSLWSPAQQRRKEILVVGRAAPEKGVLEAVKAIRMILPQLPGWTARFILSEPDRHPDYFADVRRIVDDSNGAIALITNQPHHVVKKATEEAEIALVLSKWREPFGRTAIEAHAGGAALISSGRGGLREVSADTSLYADPDDECAVAAALMKLGSDDSFRRSLAAAAQERALQKFEIRKVSATLDDVYDRYLQHYR